MDRREFLKSSFEPLLNIFNNNIDSDLPDIDTCSIIGSHPMLQNYASTSMGVAFTIKESGLTSNQRAMGYVKYWKKDSETKINAKTVKCGGYRITDINNFAMLIRLTNLQPSTTYVYKIGAYKVPINNWDNISLDGPEEIGTYEFTTAGEDSSSHFCVLNDIHCNWQTFRKECKLIKKLQPSSVLLNGDIANREENLNSVRIIWINPKLTDEKGDIYDEGIDNRGLFSSIPFLFCPGNHDQRGKALRQITKGCMYRQPEERKPRDWDLGRNFAVRTGDVAIIGMDTGEDRLDSNKVMAGLINNESYRIAQTDWLKDALEQDEIKNAPFLICACHIPLMENNPRMNGGDVRTPEPDIDSYRFRNPSADWQKTCAEMWVPLLEKHKCQLVITGHTHLYKFNAATALRPWAQIIGGGSTLTDDVEYATVIDVDVNSEKKLVVKVYKAANEKLIETHYFEPKGL